MQNNLSDTSAPKGAGKILKFALIGFVVLSVAAAVYKIAGAPCCSENKAAAEKVEAGSSSTETALPPAAKSAVKAPAAAVKKAAETKTAVVYYFYTNTRCSSCNLIENYTRESVEQSFAQPYNGWRVEFRGVNVELRENHHFVQDYWLNSKSVVVQKFEGKKPLNWGVLKDVWRLLGNKPEFMNYVTNETRKLLDEK
ncbi:MAG: hypothetical protein COT17_05725 [Elusimicrobia bacterium CG08_land_8_20_14_0_20_51_18]|nr:MAG: hypothetical protein COT17_05725 [Elusimicrobia bacterium CG08_land_8_20_14_0_20_51_18]